ncbi:MAG TPA: glycosyltransferase family 4 protein [Solirubrobacteraceae bacterium]|jgi:glycosyltransferase involved in cell wall biosynthesis|nr:glycosyltransferase family 4 protein [Solirubrobacteraceae bacterium]
MVLFLHNRYRTTGGEERTVEDLQWLVREHLHEPAELLSRDSASLHRARAAAGLLRGGLQPGDVARAVRLSRARVVHAHNLHPTLGWRALAAARGAGARVVLHLHQYRLVCAIGVCYTRGAECTRCHGRNTLPGVRLRCRGALPEAATYGAALALWQRRLLEQADALIVPSGFARERLRALGAPLPWERVHVLAPPVRALSGAALPSRAEATESEPAPGPETARSPRRPYALVVARLSPEKGVGTAIAACRLAGIALAVAGDGPELPALRELAGDGDVRFAGRVDDLELARLRAGASVALVPSRSAETFGMAAAEAMAAGLPVAASRVGALPELLEDASLAPPGDASALAGAIARVLADPDIGRRSRERVAAVCAPDVVARGLAEVYGGVATARAET